MKLRWEWRAFGDQLGAAGSELASVRFERTVESDESYLLTAAGRDAVKLRNGLMDVKHLEEVDADGLELWRPVMKSPLPISAADTRNVLAALALDAQPTESSYDFDAIAGLDPAVAVVPLHKTRRHFAFGGCMAELTDIRTADRRARTVVIESEHRDRITAAVRELGLELRPNTSVPRGLKILLGLDPA